MLAKCLSKFWFISFLFYMLHVQVKEAARLKTYLREGSDESHEKHEDKDEDNVLAGLEESEAGFDLNEDEMKKFHIWPSGVIPYFIDDFSYDKVLRDTIRAFLDHAGRLTGLRFVELLRPPEDDSRWVFFINRQGIMGCSEHPFDSFTNEGVQKVVLGYDCLKSEYGLSEVILSLVGVPPQHNAPNRDDYIIIKRNNIMPEKIQLFNVLRNDEWLFHDLDYDFKSAGHFDSHRFTINGGATIVPKDKSRYIEVGPGNCFSHHDIRKIKMLYSYISKQKNNARLPDCKKLFSPGSNFKKYKPKTENDIAPRKRPNRYLGLKDDDPEKLDEQEKSKEEEEEEEKKDQNPVKDLESKKPKTEEVDDQQENDDTTEKPIQNEDANNNTEITNTKQKKYDEENDDEDGGNTSQQLKSKRKKKKRNKGKNKHQNLLDLSDYRSEK